MKAAITLQMFGALFLHAQDSQEAQRDPAVWRVIIDGMEHMRELVCATPFKPGETPLRVVPNLEKTLFDYYYRGNYDEFWAQDCNDFQVHFARLADIPGTYSGGWFDPFAIATTTYYSTMARQNSTPQRLLMGPWTHMGSRNVLSWTNDVDFGPESVWGFAVLNPDVERWFARWLKDAHNGVEDEPPVRIFVMGGGDGRKNPEGRLNQGGQWRTEREWPLARTRFTPFLLHASGSLGPRAPADENAHASYAFDPEHPVPTLGVEKPDIVGARPPYPRLEERPDVLVFQTSPLDEDVELTGPIELRLWVSSSAPDTDLTAKLIDVYPRNEDYAQGYAMNLCDSIIRARYRAVWHREVMLQPAEIAEVSIQLPPTSNVFKCGHHIRLDISSSNFPRFNVNPNTGEPMGRHTHMQIATNAVHFDRAHPSHVVLPVIPA